MTDSQPRTKTLYLNGIAVGKYESTGDRQQEIEITRTLLKSKGLYRETTQVQAMFRQAISFATTATYLYENDLRQVPRNGHSIAPFIVNSAFSIELYLKTLAQIHETSLRGHRILDDLFDRLPAEAHRAVEAAVPTCAKKWGISEKEDFRAYVGELNNVFVDWRYCYEKNQTTEIRITPMIFVMEVFHEACRASGKT
jgi:hypothetical protein